MLKSKYIENAESVIGSIDLLKQAGTLWLGDLEGTQNINTNERQSSCLDIHWHLEFCITIQSLKDGKIEDCALN